MFQTLITLALALSVNTAYAQSSSSLTSRQYESQYGYVEINGQRVVEDAQSARRLKGTTKLPAIRPTAIPKFPPGANYGTYYNWILGNDGWGYCAQFGPNGSKINNEEPVSDNFCEKLNPSFYHWAEGRNGIGYCYKFTPYNVAMNQGYPMESDEPCENMDVPKSKSKPGWGETTKGKLRCYQMTPNGFPMNEGKPIPDSMCYDTTPQPQK